MIKLTVVAFIFLFVGCSKVNVAYDLAPRLITSNLDDNFDFSSARYEKIKEIITVDFQNNKGLLKSEVLARIDEMAAVADSAQLQESQVESFVKNIRGTQQKIVTAFKPSFSEVVLKMTDDELKNLVKETEERHKKSEERLADKSKFIDRAYSNFEKNMETLFDEVTPEQKQIYVGLVERNWTYFGLQLEYRKNYLKKFADIFQEKDKLLELVFKYYSGNDELKNENHLKAQEKFFKDMYASTLALWATLTPEQKQNYKKALAEIRADIEKLK